MAKGQSLNWPGWSLGHNPHGGEFDTAARERMVAGSELLLPLLKKYRRQLENALLEVGPFFNPLLTPDRFPQAKICYWENDRHVLRFLRQQFSARRTYPIYCDLNAIEGDSLLVLKQKTSQYFRQLRVGGDHFDAAVASHVFNYIDYKLFLVVLKDFLKPGGLLFINNVVDYGLSRFFSRRRPKSIPQTLAALRSAGYTVLEKKILPSPDRKHQPQRRLLVVARADR